MAMSAVAPVFALSSPGLSSSTREGCQRASRRNHKAAKGHVSQKHAPSSTVLLDASCTGLRRECTLDRLSSSAAGPSSLLASLAAATNVRHRGGARRGVIVAIFEKFTERAIKAVMNSQKEAKALGKREVCLACWSSSLSF